VQFNPIEISNNLKKNGGFIPGFRPGKPTSDFILKVINKITFSSARCILGIVAILPIIVAGVISRRATLSPSAARPSSSLWALRLRR
jgi:preprotein translocase subunit SecY